MEDDATAGLMYNNDIVKKKQGTDKLHAKIEAKLRAGYRMRTNGKILKILTSLKW